MLHESVEFTDKSTLYSKYSIKFPMTRGYYAQIC